MPILPGIDYQIQAPLSDDIILNNDQNTPLTIVTLDVTSIKSYIIEYSIIRSSTTEVGRIFIATDGTSLSFEEDKANNVDTGVTIFGALSGSNVIVRYMSTNTGQTGIFRYSKRTMN
jgi:hypothetical protein